MMRQWIRPLLAVLLCIAGSAAVMFASTAAKRHQATGMVLDADRVHRVLDVSCDEVPDYMSAMEMLFKLRDSAAVSELKPGARISFAIVEEGKALYAENIHV